MADELEEKLIEQSKRHDNLAAEVNALVKKAEAAERKARRAADPGDATVRRSTVRAVATVGSIALVVVAAVAALYLLLAYGVL